MVENDVEKMNIPTYHWAKELENRIEKLEEGFQLIKHLIDKKWIKIEDKEIKVEE